MASASIPGFKKQELSFEAVRAGMLSPNRAAALSQPVALPATRSHLNFSAGDVRRTDGNTDFAIEGKGFFEVQLPNGATGYTRDGEFKINAQGQLVTKQGYLVMGQGGPIQIDTTLSTGITVAPDGTISQGAEVRGRMNIVTVNDPNLLTPTSGGFFLANNPAIQTETDANSILRQGFLEGSNTSAVAEMANMITVMRAYEANQRVVQLQDERMGRAITELGNPN